MMDMRIALVIKGSSSQSPLPSASNWGVITHINVEWIFSLGRLSHPRTRQSEDMTTSIALNGRMNGFDRKSDSPPQSMLLLYNIPT